MAMSLAEVSEVRKSKLLALRRRRAGENGDEPVLSTRNFDPTTRTLRKRGVDDGENEDTVEKAVEGVAERVLAEDEERQAQDLDLMNIAPKRANWDLKRDMDKKMARLERRTQEAIHALIRQRLTAQKGESDDLVGAMNASGAINNADDSDDDE